MSDQRVKRSIAKAKKVPNLNNAMRNIIKGVAKKYAINHGITLEGNEALVFNLFRQSLVTNFGEIIKDSWDIEAFSIINDNPLSIEQTFRLKSKIQRILKNPEEHLWLPDEVVRIHAVSIINNTVLPKSISIYRSNNLEIVMYPLKRMVALETNGKTYVRAYDLSSSKLMSGIMTKIIEDRPNSGSFNDGYSLESYKEK